MEECRCRYCDCVAETTVQYVCEDCNINCYKGHGGTLRPCKNCAQEAVDPNFEWDENDLLTCGCCKNCGCDCGDWEETVRKYMKRSGVRRIYSYKDVRERGRLKLEFVLRGNVLFYLPLWSIKSMMEK